MNNKASLVLGIGIMVLSGWAVAGAMHWPWKAALFPLVIGIPVFCMAAIETVCGLWPRKAQAGASSAQPEAEAEPAAPYRLGVAVTWIFALIVLIVLLGFTIAVPLFVLLYLRLQGGESWAFSVVFTALFATVFYGLFDRLLHLPFPAGWLQTWLGLA